MNFRRRTDNDLERDIKDHIEMDIEENIARGMSPEDAKHAALRKFGSTLRVTEDTRAVWHWMWLERLRQDSRYAIRGLIRNPMFAAVAILTLALGIGMNTAVFSVVNGVLIRPLPYPDPQRIVWVANYNQRFKFEASSAPDFTDWRNQSRSFEAMAGYGTIDSSLQDGDDSSKRSFVYTTPEFWHIAGAHAALGRLFSDRDRDVVVLTWNLYQQQFGGNPHVLGRVVTVDGRHETIIGVLPEGFRFLPPPGMMGGMSGDAEAFTPNIITPAEQMRGRNLRIMFVVAKLKPGVSLEKARAELNGLQSRIAHDNPATAAFYSAAQLRVIPLQEKLVGSSRRALLILLTAVAFVLLIACANLGNLLLARATARQREIAIRAAIGAGRGRLFRHFLVEGLTLAALGGGIGLLVARGAIALLIHLSPTSVPRLSDVSIDWRVCLFALVISTASGVIFGLAPMSALARSSANVLLKEGDRGSSAGPAGVLLRRMLVGGELAMALVLLAAAGLMVKSFARMYSHAASFEPEKIATMKVFLSGPAYRQTPAAIDYSERLISQISRVPGVEAAAITNVNGSGAADLEGPPRFPAGQAPQVFFRSVSGGYPQVVGIPLLKGRWIADDEPVPAVMVNETFARVVFGGDNPLGHRVRVNGQYSTIAGVVGDLKIARLDADPDPEVLLPYKRSVVIRRLDVLVKTNITPAVLLPQLRRVVQQLDPTQPPYAMTTLDAELSDSIASRRFSLSLLGTFAVSAVLLALIGIYGVMSYAVTQRTREIGVRMALGAHGSEIVWMMVRQGMLTTAAGITVGVVAALGLTRTMASLLFEVKPNDPLTYVMVVFLLVITALLACWIPAMRAARVDPLNALRYE